MAGRILYKEVKEKLIQCLVDGEWAPGTVLPNEATLAHRYGVSISTLRAAVTELESAGILMRMQGKGTFVTSYAERSSAHKFFNFVRSSGAEIYSHRQLLKIEVVSAPRKVSIALKLLEKESEPKVYKLTTLLSSHGLPILYSNVFLAKDLFPGLRADMVPDGNTSLYSIYQNHFNINVVTIRDMLGAGLVTEEFTSIIGLPVGTPVITQDRIAYTYNDEPVEVRQNWLNTTAYRYQVVQGDTHS